MKLIWGFARQYAGSIEDLSPFTIEERLAYAPNLLKALLTSGELRLDDGLKFSEVGDLVNWTLLHLNDVYDSSRNVFEILFKVYDVVWNSFDIYSEKGTQIGGKNGLLAMLKKYLRVDHLVNVRPEEIDIEDIEDFETQLINIKAVFLLGFNPQGEYSDQTKKMEKCIRRFNPQISHYELIKRQLEMVAVAGRIWRKEPYTLNGFYQDKSEAWEGEDQLVLFLAKDRIMRDLNPIK